MPSMDEPGAFATAEPPLSAPATLVVGAADVSSAVKEPGQTKVPVRQLLPIFLTTFTLFAAYITPLSFSLAVRVAQVDPANKDLMLALAIGIPGLLVVFFNPLVGVLSDRTRSNFGRRRQWMLLSAVVSLAGMVLIGVAPSAVLIIVGWAIAFVGYSVAAAMVTAHFGDRLPESQRGKVMGVNGALTNISPIFGTVIAASFVASPLLLFVVPAVVAFAGALLFVLFAKDPKYTGPVPAFSVKQLARGFYFNPRTYPNLGWVWVSRALVFVALSFLSLYTVYLLSARLGMSNAEIGALSATLGLVGVVAGIVGAVGSGWLSDKLHSRKPFLFVSALLLAVSMVLIASMTSIPQYIVASVLSGLAIGAYGAVDQALAFDIIPHQENQNGRYLAIFGLGSAVPQAIGPFFAGGILAAVGGEYGWVYAVGGLFAIAGAFAILPIKMGQKTGVTASAVPASR
jgi:MFS family permease